MKRIYIILLAAMLISIIPAKLYAQVDAGDSLALVDLYNNTDGSNWFRNTNWLTTSPVKTWTGIKVAHNRVTLIGLSSNNLNGAIPSSIGNLSDLLTLDLHFNSLQDSIPATVGNLVKLQNLDFSYNGLSGIIPSSIGNLVKVQTLNLNGNALSGSIPGGIGNLVSLSHLQLDVNLLSGNIPGQISNLIKLEYLNFEHNYLEGPIPASIGKLVKLHFLSLNDNGLSGTIPVTIGNLTKLEYLYVGRNQLTGSIPVSLSHLSPACYFEFNENLLSGLIPNPPVFVANASINIYSNYYNFDAFEPIVSKYANIRYSPQRNIELHRNQDLLTVTAGGTFSNNTYRWYRNGQLVKSAIGDSSFLIPSPGKYYVAVSNSVVTKLKMISNILLITSLAPLANTTGQPLNANNHSKPVTGLLMTVSKLSLSPNPAKDFLDISFNKTGNAFIKIYDENGRTVYSSRMTVDNKQPLSVNISMLLPGNYFIAVNLDGEMMREKFIKINK